MQMAGACSAPAKPEARLKSTIEKLSGMANQIAQFFASYPRDEAVAGIASHIEAFWAPKMIDALKSGMADTKLDPLVREALSPQVAARDPAEKADAGPGKLGELGAVDAG